MNIISIVPSLPPAIDGLGDYAFRQAQQLYQDHRLSTHFIVGDPNWRGQVNSPGISAIKIPARSADCLLTLLKKYRQTPTVVLLHYSGYGYANRSCCCWLVEGLERWKRHIRGARLVTMFHEIYSAFGVPWKHHFWVSPIQRYLAARLIQLSDSYLTNTEVHAEMLAGLDPQSQRQVPILPVISNIGEPLNILPLSKRRNRLVIFGQANSRKNSYRDAYAMISWVCRNLNIEQIFDIGRPTGLRLHSVGTVPILELGECADIEISQILQTSIAGFLSYDARRLAKSGIFAAYCAHGLLPISPNYNSGDHDRIVAGQHYWLPDMQDISPCPEQLQTIANNAYLWYQTHNLSKQTQIFAANLIEPTLGEN